MAASVMGSTIFIDDVTPDGGSRNNSEVSLNIMFANLAQLLHAKEMQPNICFYIKKTYLL